MNRWIVLLLPLLWTACGQRGAVAPKEKFRLPEIPAVISSPQERALFLSKYYWDRFDFTDTAEVASPVLDQVFADYLGVITQIPLSDGVVSIRVMMQKTEADSAALGRFTDLSDHYLYDPNSPLRNEELYISVLEFLVSSPAVPELEKIRPRARLEMALKNRPGTPAADFSYTLASGRTGTLHGIRADYTLLFFNNPGCPACKEMQEAVTSSPLLAEMIDKGTLKVLALYPDEDLKAWRDYAPNIPREWINAYDRGQELRDGELYDLKAIPSLYLLGKDKKVVLKDCATVQQIADYLDMKEGGC